ncbi:olfactory receptor 11H4-like [Conger conger]|uniref:olfactory receptor 11H4-like n=1 Tax=Conger conger TaxID=82655 RepID=UPI002A59966B|nr:olfactory receptor 11H4-like [Conger conger]
MLVLLLSRNYQISLTHCLLQTYCLYSYGTVEFTILAVMAYDRYVAICHPLHYHVHMIMDKLYCSGDPLMKLACSDTSVQQTVGLVSLFVSPGSQVIMILFSYVVTLNYE